MPDRQDVIWIDCSSQAGREMRDPQPFLVQAALDLTVHLERIVAGFSRDHKHAPGTALRQGSRAVLLQVLRADNARARPARDVVGHCVAKTGVLASWCKSTNVSPP